MKTPHTFTCFIPSLLCSSSSSSSSLSLSNISLDLQNLAMIWAASSALTTVSLSNISLDLQSLGLLVKLQNRRTRGGAVVAMAGGKANSRSITGLIFEPFEELKGDLSLVPTNPEQSLARHKFPDDCEAAINDQINVEYNVSYVYHAMYAYFDRDNIALKGLANFFHESSEDEREHAEKLMEYQNKRGGRVKLQTVMMPLSEFDHSEKGEALHAMELALSLEKLTSEKLHNLHKVAERCHDIQLMDFVDNEFLGPQVESVKEISEYVAQLRRVDKGHGVWHFDQMLLNK